MKNKNKNKKLIILIILLIIVAVCLFFGIRFIQKNLYMKRYSKYAEYVKNMELDTKYEKEKDLYDFVTYREAAGLLVFAASGNEKLENLGYVSEEGKLNSDAIEFLKSKEIKVNPELTDENLNKKIKRIDVVRLLGNLKEQYLGKKLNLDEKVTFKISRAHKLAGKDLEYLKDLVTTDVIENNGSVSDSTYIRRGELDRIVYGYLMANNVLSTDFGNSVRKLESLPTNWTEYPFILEGVDKALYENIERNTISYKTPATTYAINKSGYINTATRLKSYLELLTNVDYNTINYDELYAKYDECTQYFFNEEELKAYVEYVKEHKLVLKGKADIVVPSLFKVDDNAYMRAKISFDIVEGDTKTNVIFGDVINDEKSKNEYQEKNEFIIDCPEDYGIYLNGYYPEVMNIHEHLADMGEK